MKKTQLVLDVAGVLITNFSPAFWYETTRADGISFDELKRLFATEIRKPLWTGQISEEEFWNWLGGYCPVEPVELKTKLFNNLNTMPAFDLIPMWSELTDIHLLSNHRSEWLEILLEPILPYLASITVSSDAGCCKPDLSIYQIVASKLDQGKSTIYVDDQEKNLRPAEAMSWGTVLADPEGQWIELIHKKLQAVDTYIT